MGKGPCSVALEMDPPHTMVTSLQVSLTFSICNSNPRQEQRGQTWVLDYMCKVIIAMLSLRRARWQPCMLENWVFAGNCLNFIAETKLVIFVLGASGSHSDRFHVVWKGWVEGGEKSQGNIFHYSDIGQGKPYPKLAQEKELEITRD